MPDHNKGRKRNAKRKVVSRESLQKKNITLSCRSAFEDLKKADSKIFEKLKWQFFSVNQLSKAASVTPEDFFLDSRVFVARIRINRLSYTLAICAEDSVDLKIVENVWKCHNFITSQKEHAESKIPILFFQKTEGKETPYQVSHWNIDAVKDRLIAALLQENQALKVDHFVRASLKMAETVYPEDGQFESETHRKLYVENALLKAAEKTYQATIIELTAALEENKKLTGTNFVRSGERNNLEKKRKRLQEDDGFSLEKDPSKLRMDPMDDLVEYGVPTPPASNSSEEDGFSKGQFSRNNIHSGIGSDDFVFTREDSNGSPPSKGLLVCNEVFPSLDEVLSQTLFGGGVNRDVTEDGKQIALVSPG